MQVLKLDVENFRCIKKLSWEPRLGRNVLIGPANSGKSTILEALRLLLGADQGYRGEAAFTRYDLHGLKHDGDCIVRIGAVLQPTEEEWLVFPELEEPQYPNARAWGDHVEGPTLDGLDESPVLRVALFYRWDAEDPDDRAVWFFPKFEPPPHPDCRRVGYAQRQAFGFWYAPYDDPLWEVASLSTRSQLARAMRAQGWDALSAEGIPAVMDALLEHVEGKAEKLPKWEAVRKMSKAIETQLQALIPSVAQESHMGITASLTDAWLQRIMEIGLRTEDTPYIPISRQGAGTKRVFMIAARAACAGAGTPATADRAKSILAMDEPEVGLHAQAQRALLASIAEGDTQSFIATHSTAVVQASRPHQVWRLQCVEGCVTPVSVSVEAGNGTEEQIRKNAERFWMDCSRGLFGRVVLLVEGATEEGALPAFDDWARAELQDYVGFDAMGLAIVGVDGICNVAPAARVLGTYGIVVVALHDGDAGPKQREEIREACDFVCHWPDTDECRDLELMMANGTSAQALLRLLKEYGELYDTSRKSFGREIWDSLPCELTHVLTEPNATPEGDIGLITSLAERLDNGDSVAHVRKWLASFHRGPKRVFAKSTRYGRLWAEACVEEKSVPPGILSLLQHLSKLGQVGFDPAPDLALRVHELACGTGGGKP